MDAHGETRPRKRSNRKHNKEGRHNVEIPEPEILREKIIEEEDVGDDSWNDYHVEEESSASLTYKILFFILLLLLGALATVVLIDNNNYVNSVDVPNGVEEKSPAHDVPVEEGIASSWFDWLTNEEPEDHGIVEEHSDEAREFIDHDHDDEEHDAHGDHDDDGREDDQEVDDDDDGQHEQGNGEDDGNDEDDSNDRPEEEEGALEPEEPVVEETISYTTHEPLNVEVPEEEEEDDDADDVETGAQQDDAAQNLNLEEDAEPAEGADGDDDDDDDDNLEPPMDTNDIHFTGESIGADSELDGGELSNFDVNNEDEEERDGVAGINSIDEDEELRQLDKEFDEIDQEDGLDEEFHVQAESVRDFGNHNFEEDPIDEEDAQQFL